MYCGKESTTTIIDRNGTIRVCAECKTKIALEVLADGGEVGLTSREGTDIYQIKGDVE